MASPQIEQFWNDLIADIKANRLELPALPDIALKTRQLLDRGNVTATQVAKVINADVVLSTRLLRVVNSPLYRGARKIDDIQSAITRLGNSNVRSIITTIAMEQIFQSRLASPLKKKLLEQNWNHSVHVAAMSHVIAQNFTSLKADEAMLAGLIHDIGKLPILEYTELMPELLDNEAVLNRILEVLHTKVGALILRSWKFPVDLIAVASEHEDLARDPAHDADLTDVVIIANLLSYVGTDHPHTRHDWSTIPAFQRLALTPEESIAIIRDAREEIMEIKQLFAQ